MSDSSMTGDPIMTTSTRKLSVSIFLLCACAFAQVTSTVGPSPAPVGGFIAVSIANDTATNVSLPSPCAFLVRDAVGTVYFDPAQCPPINVVVPAGTVWTLGWIAGVPPGNYLVDVFIPGQPITTTPLVIDASVEAAIAQRGPMKIGTTRSFLLDSPADPAFQYLMAASGPVVSGGIPTCAGVVQLEDDPLLQLSLGPNPFFSSFTGFLNPTGQGWSPTVNIPNEPSLVGVQVTFAFIVLDTNLMPGCTIRSISAPIQLTIVK
jgi:hypothetical protein